MRKVWRAAPLAASARIPSAGVAGGGMAREPEEEETVRPAALVRHCPRCPGAPRPPLWLLCLVACWILGAVADADFSILDEAQVLASQMRRLAAEELGVVTMQVSDPLRAASLTELSRCAEPRGAARSFQAGCGSTRLLQTSPHPVLSVPGTHLPLPSSAEPLPRTHFPPLLDPGSFLVGWGFSALSAPPSPVCTLFLRRFVFTRHSCKLPFPLCVPIPRQRVSPGSEYSLGLPHSALLKPPSVLETLAHQWAREGR